MVNEKNIDPRKIIIMIIAIILALIIKNLMIGTLCIEEYQIAKCPNNLSLNSYYIKAENEKEANNKVKAILQENNFNLDDYEIQIDNNIIKIVNVNSGTIIDNKNVNDNTKDDINNNDVNEEEKAGLKNKETSETILQENNLEIENESVEFNNENNTINKSVRSIEGLFNIIEVPNEIDILIGFAMFSDAKEYNELIEWIKIQIQGNIEANNINYNLDKCEIILEDLEGNTIDKNTFNNNNYDELNVRVREKKEETTETTEGGGTINNADIKELKEINMCICMLLAIIFIYNFTNSMFRRN